MSCISIKNHEYPTGIVEFRFDLLAAQDQMVATVNELPMHSSAYKLEFSLRKFENDEESQEIMNELSPDAGSTLQVAVIDDEIVYARTIETAVKSLGLPVRLQLRTSPTDFSLSLLSEIAADLFTRFQRVCKKRSKKQNLDQIDHLGGGL